MKLLHTSPAEIAKINKFGRFGEFLFFSQGEYVMTAGRHVTYKIDVDEDSIIDAELLFFHADAAKLDALVAEVMEMLGCDETTAEKMLAQKADCGDAEMSWEIQRMTAQCAKTLGYRGAYMPDEQGTCYMISMFGRESELTRAEQGEAK